MLNTPSPLLSELEQTSPRAGGPAALEDPLYYLRNFEWVLRWVGQRYGDLLPSDERDFMEEVLNLPDSSRGLLVRMVMRKGVLFRPDALNYPELGETAVIAKPLLANGWLEPQPTLAIDDVFRLFTWARLKRALLPWLKAINFPPNGRKGEALERLKNEALGPRLARDWGLEGEDVWHLTVMNRCDRLRWLFFGNAYQDWSEFVLTELGLFQYEPVVFDESARPVHSRTELETYWQLMECRALWQEEESPDTILSQLPPEPQGNLWLNRHYQRLVFKIGRHWERAGDLLQACELYERCTYPGARGRQMRVLERLEAYDAALTLAQLARENPESEAELQQLERLVPRLRRKRFKEKATRPTAPETTVIHLTLPPAPFVEQAVANHLATAEAPVVYAENTLLTGLFGLLCWDPVFQPLPGAFFHPFQRGPADLHWPDFYRRRATDFEECLSTLRDGRYTDRIWQTFRNKRGRQSPFVFWGALTEELLTLALDCIPPSHLEACFRRLLRDIKANRAGLPDLIQFFPGQREYRMIEVKGPGDRLQDNQKRWLAFFDAQGIPATVCYVTWTEHS